MKNFAFEGGGLYLDDMSALDVFSSDFSENTPHDIWGPGPFTAGEDATFTCDPGEPCD